MVIGQQHGKVIFATVVSVTDRLGGGATKYVVRVKHLDRLSPGKVVWTAYLQTPGDVDGPGGDGARTSTLLVEHHRGHERC